MNGLNYLMSEQEMHKKITDLIGRLLISLKKHKRIKLKLIKMKNVKDIYQKLYHN